MNGKHRLLIAFLLGALLAVPACREGADRETTVGDTETQAPDTTADVHAPDPPEKMEEDVEPYYLENNYVYMWQKDGLKGTKRRLCVQSETYGLLVDGKTGKLIGAAPADPNGPFAEMDIDTLPAVDMAFELKNGDAQAFVSAGSTGAVLAGGMIRTKQEVIQALAVRIFQNHAEAAAVDQNGIVDIGYLIEQQTGGTGAAAGFHLTDVGKQS